MMTRAGVTVFRGSSAACQNDAKSVDGMRLAMSVQALGYIGLRARELDDWASFGANCIGMQRIDKTRSTMAFRMDDRKQRVVIEADGGQGIAYFGWEVADAAALAALAARLEAERRQGCTRVARARRRAAREGPHRLPGPGRDAA